MMPPPLPPLDARSSILPDMGEFGLYIWTAYGVTSVLLIILLLATLNDMRRTQQRLKLLQTSLNPDR